MRKYRTLIIAIVILLSVVAIWYFFLRNPSKKKSPKGRSKTSVSKPASTTPPGSPTSTWVEESFPLNLGMYGGYTQQLQAALNIPQTGQFGTEIKDAVIARGATVPLSKSDYNLIALVGQKVSAYADGIMILNDDFTLNQTPVKEGDLLGTIQNVVIPSNSGPTAQLLGDSYLINPISGSVINNNIYVQMSDVFFNDLT